MPVPWFTVEEEKPDIGTVIFKADNYYERLQHITGMWNNTKYLYYEMSPDESADENTGNKPDPGSELFTVNDITNVPLLLAFLDRANMKTVLPPVLLDFMWDLHKLFIKKMTEFGYSTHWMSKKEYALLENRKKWTKLVNAMEQLRLANEKEEKKVKRRKRLLKPTQLKIFRRLEDLPGVQVTKEGNLVLKKPVEKNSKRQSIWKSSAKDGKSHPRKSKVKKNIFDLLHDDPGASTKDRERRKRKDGAGAFFSGTKPLNEDTYDYGETRLFDRKHLRPVGQHFEFTRIFHKISKALRFSYNEPIEWRTITLAEVDKHRYSSDCWMVIKGRVYDITGYLSRHPGGAQLIMQGVGTDATELFVAVHPYVVFYQHLTGKQVGTVPNYKEHIRTPWEPPQYFNIYQLFKEWFYRPKQPYKIWTPKTSFKQTDTEYVYTVTFPKNLVSQDEDWTITIINGFTVTVIKFVDPPYVWYSGFDLRTKVMDDTVYRSFSPDSNSVEIKIAKTYKVNVKKPIKDKRQDDGFFLSSYALKDMYRASIVERTSIASGVKLYGITVGMNKLIGCPIGCYVNLRILDETRPYTPVCLLDEFDEKFVEESGDFQTLFFIIKEFKDGDFTSMLHHMPIKSILEGVDIYVSPPMGNFQVDFLFSEMDIMLLIAGGTGISVMTRIIQKYIQQNEQMTAENKTVCLLHFVQHREDLIWNIFWVELAKKYNWFHYYYSLSRVFRFVTEKKEKEHHKHGTGHSRHHKTDKAKDEPKDDSKESESKATPKVLEFEDSNPQELFGYPSTTKLEHIFRCISSAQESAEKRHKVIVCGPYGFNHSCRRMLAEFGMHKEDNIHYFAG